MHNMSKEQCKKRIEPYMNMAHRVWWERVYAGLIELSKEQPLDIWTRVSVPFTSGYTPVLDFVVMSETNIFVVKCKNWSGIISANYDSGPRWIQYCNNGTIKWLPSPVSQNNLNIEALSAYLHIPVASIVSLVAFSDWGSLRTMPSASHLLIVGKLSDILARIQCTSFVQITTVQREAACERLDHLCLRSQHSHHG